MDSFYRSNAHRQRLFDKGTEDCSPDKRVVHHLERETIALAAGTVTAALAANAAAMGSATSPEKVCICAVLISLWYHQSKFLAFKNPVDSVTICIHALDW